MSTKPLTSTYLSGFDPVTQTRYRYRVDSTTISDVTPIAVALKLDDVRMEPWGSYDEVTFPDLLKVGPILSLVIDGPIKIKA